MINKRSIFLFGFILVLAASAGAEVVDRIIAVVGDEAITERELDLAYDNDLLGVMAPDPVTGEKRAEVSHEEYLDLLIEKKVIEQEVKRQGIKVDTFEVEKAIDRKQETLGLDDEEFARALASQGISLDSYREQVKEQLITYRLISQEVRGEIEVTDEEVISFYNQHPDLFVEPDKFTLRHIFIAFKPEDDPAGAGAAAELEQIRQKILLGADFAEMALLYSQSPTAPQGGDLGEFTLAELLPEFKDKVKGLGEGQMTPVFIQGNGAHLILVEKITKGGPKDLEDVRKTITDVLYQRETMERYDLWLNRLKARAHIENRLRDPLPGPEISEKDK